jgi:hypothetical protein
MKRRLRRVNPAASRSVGDTRYVRVS